MRKQNPNDVVDDFRAELVAIRQDWQALRMALGRTSGPLAKRATTVAFTRAAVAFEGLRSNWHIAAINRDSSTLRAALEAEAVSLVRAGSNPTLSSRVRIDLPLHPPLALIRDLLDAKGDHLSIGSHKHWMTRAKAELDDPWRGKIIRMHNADRAVMDAVIALRNVLAHNSTRAGESATDALAKFLPKDAGLLRSGRGIQPSGLPAYLNAVTPSGLEILVSRLDDVAQALVL